MKSTVTIALLVAAGFLAGCAANEPTIAAPDQAAASPTASAANEEKARLGSRLNPRPAEAQPVRSVGNREWRDSVTTKPQPMPGGS